MGTRLELHAELLLIVPNVYFQPPESVKLSYPCIVYERSDIAIKHAGNKPYYHKDEYTITVMDRDPDSVIPKTIASMPTARLNRHFVADNLNHDRFTIFY